MIAFFRRSFCGVEGLDTDTELRKQHDDLADLYDHLPSEGSGAALYGTKP